MTHQSHEALGIIESIDQASSSTIDDDFQYNETTGFLHDSQNKVLLFRAEQTGQTTVTRRAVETAAGDGLQIYGRGLYFGNTPESVAPYAWLRPNTAIHAYLTAPINDEVIHSISPQKNYEALAELIRIVRLRRIIGTTALVDQIDTSYGAAEFIARDMGLDMKTGQYLSSKTTHSVRPRWGILRSSHDNLEQVGTASTPSQPYRWLLAAAKHAYEIRQS